MKTITLLSLLLCVNTLFAQQTVGLFTQDPGSLDGYVLFAPTRSDTTYLIDKCGKEIHQWSSIYTPGLSAYLLPNGNLLRSGFYPNPYFNGPGGVIEIYDWNNTLLWSYVLCNAIETQNHDVYPMPNGNILVAIWEKFTNAEAIAAGKNPAALTNGLISAKIQEIQPVGSNMANIVWEWSLWDHLVQDFDAVKANYGVVTDHPELLNINFTNGNPGVVDWIHLNAVTYNEALDQVMISNHTLSEIYIIDHSTTTAEAASHSGGAHGIGGDFLYRWGNPAAYDRGNASDQRLFSQHSPEWIPAGYPDANKIMIFNNGVNRPGGNASSVDIISPPVDSAGNYYIAAGVAYDPVNPYWSYSDTVPVNFFSGIMGGSQRLPNGNTLICESTKGNFFEIDSAKNTVWRYVNPVNNFGRITQGTIPMGNLAYRSVYYPLSYSGFSGLTLTPGDPIELNPLPYVCDMNTATGMNDLHSTTDKFISVNNPFNQTILLNSGKEIKNLTVTLYSITGNELFKWDAVSIHEKGQVNLPVNGHLPVGIYFLNYSNNEINGIEKLIKLNN
ncbi:MAG TPA: aryl-sulfate sulfotransferase [Bacteroidia bacterium]|nr:aryl-sulfate sulfotransferase [Bacteroidia bacterium]